MILSKCCNRPVEDGEVPGGGDGDVCTECNNFCDSRQVVFDHKYRLLNLLNALKVAEGNLFSAGSRKGVEVLKQMVEKAIEERYPEDSSLERLDDGFVACLLNLEWYKINERT